MNEFAKTGVFLGGAAVLVLLALVARPGAVENDLFSDQGEVFFAQFTEPTQAAALEVWEFREATGEALPFKVRRDDKGVWTIESHHGYPADAKSRMAKAATMVIGLRKERAVSDRKDQHVDLGVVDPSDREGELRGRGTRVTFKDAGGNVLADLIVGKAVEGKTDVRYVRVPEKRRVYAAKIDAELSTRFEDWIERDLLKASSWDMTGVTFDNYSFDEQELKVVPGEKLVVKKDTSSKWVLEGLGASEATNETRIAEVTTALDDLKIVGVRPKPAALTGGLELRTGADRNSVIDLFQRGFFLTRDGKLYSNEGDLIVNTRKGVVYTLKFGEIVYGSGEAVTAGTEAPKPEPGKDPSEGPQPVAGNHRYLMITARFDESLLEEPKQPRIAQEELDKRKTARKQIESIVGAIDAWKQQHEGRLPGALAELTQGEEPPLQELVKDPWGQDYVLEVIGESFAVLSHGADQKEGGRGADLDVRSDQFAAEDELQNAAADWKAYDDKVQEGTKEAESLTRRFGPWYYVIDQDAFTKLKPARKDLVQEKAATPPGPGGEDK